MQRTTVQMPTSEIDRQSNESIVDEGLHLDKGGGVEELSGEASSGSSVYPTRHCVLAWSGKVKPRLLPRSLFLETARREQLRAIRTNAKVCMVLVSIDKALRECPDALFELSGRLQNHIRETDLLGWYAHNRLALLLLDTDEHAARECIDRIKLKETTEETGPSLEFQLLSYSESAFSLGESPWSKLDQPRFIDADPKLVPRSQLLVKRLLDLFGSLTAILLLSPVMLTTAIVIKATSRGPVIFRQVRLGKDGRPFTFLKFRSMRADADQSLHRKHVEALMAKGEKDEASCERKAWFKMEADPRITPVGRFLRKSSIDELPQLFNVLKGDMSLVGPRPPIPYEVESYSAWHLRRILEVKPGITGFWQVEGRGAVTFDDMVRLDLQYARHWTLLTDIRILLKTVVVVLQRRGAA
ncbi:exopolysaccharide biosynthesis polyprenyl glycosylphosphotransferase [Thioalkalicoccus limnaeus]|uniref:Exopolysaccharide biosynthesis polyprenyl glycosylphosphotransferase n=1 Tax=Thioalkalicoccus limnaeus TaxID=120681 RepID=A0ABV4BJA1_9GAMM